MNHSLNGSLSIKYEQLVKEESIPGPYLHRITINFKIDL